MKNKVRTWYMAAYPTDDMGAYINKETTFLDVLDGLKAKLDLYSILGVGDSLVRESVFSKLADLAGCDYNYIYKLWLYGET